MTGLEKTLSSENKELKSQLVKYEEYLRRNNLLSHGLDKRDGEDCEQLIQAFLANQLHLNTSDRGIMISKTHRLGQKVDRKVRPIIAQFVLSSDVGAILKKRSLLLQNSVRGSPRQKVYITKDNPEEIVKVQNYLHPVLKLVKMVDKDSHIS